jgi:hypothetical protein
MSVFRSIESKLANLVEGSFSRAFKSEVRPVEIARRLAREMDENRKAFVSRVYVPTVYTVFLSPNDFDRFAEHQDELKTELSAYLLEHARRENLVLSERPRISIESDQRLSLGEFGIRTSPVDKAALAGASSEQKAPQRQAPQSPRVAPPAAPPVPLVAPIAAAAAAPSPPRMTPPTPPVSAPKVEATPDVEPPTVAPAVQPTGGAKLLAAGMTIEVAAAGTVLGRSSQCDVRLEDPNASRQHARISGPGGSWKLEDLGSTNGVLVNGARVAGSTPLRSGDRIQLGHTDMTFEID